VDRVYVTATHPKCLLSNSLPDQEHVPMMEPWELAGQRGG
jgi:hypothetical protein